MGLADCRDLGTKHGEAGMTVDELIDQLLKAEPDAVVTVCSLTYHYAIDNAEVSRDEVVLNLGDFCEAGYRLLSISDSNALADRT
jgi:hypothetical protein